MKLQTKHACVKGRDLLWVLMFSACAFGQQGLPPVPEPAGNPSTPAKVVLGKVLFWDEQLSQDDTVACGTCHRPEAGGGDPRALTPAGRHPGLDLAWNTIDDGRGSPTLVRCGPDGSFVDDGVFFPDRVVTRRKAPGIIGGAWDALTYWDGRAAATFVDTASQQTLLPSGATLENQVAEVTTSVEMGCLGRTWSGVTTKLASSRPLRLATNLTPDIQSTLQANSTYPQLFSAAFGDPSITRERVAMAIASYERVLVPDQTPYDAWVNGQGSALTPAQVNGFNVLVASYCVFCHTLPHFTDHQFRNIGVRPPSEDLGRGAVTGLYSDRGKFKTPTLRNVGLRAPYLHNGSSASLTDIMLFYERGGDFSENRDNLMVSFVITASERSDAVDFMQNGLTDPRCVQGLPPFDHPTLRSELSPNPSFSGVGSAGTGGLVPKMVAPRPPVIGGSGFGLGLAHGLPGAFAWLAVSTIAASPATLIGPHEIGLALDPVPFLIPVTLNLPTATSLGGYASLVAPINDNPTLSGLTLHTQWIVSDPAGVFGLCVSERASFTFFAP